MNSFAKFFLYITKKNETIEKSSPKAKAKSRNIIQKNKNKNNLVNEKGTKNRKKIFKMRKLNENGAKPNDRNGSKCFFFCV